MRLSLSVMFMQSFNYFTEYFRRYPSSHMQRPQYDDYSRFVAKCATGANDLTQSHLHTFNMIWEFAQSLLKSTLWWANHKSNVVSPPCHILARYIKETRQLSSLTKIMSCTFLVACLRYFLKINFKRYNLKTFKVRIQLFSLLPHRKQGT